MYSWFIMLCSFHMYSKEIQLYIYIYIFFLFQNLFSHRLSQNIEQSSLCCTVGPCWLSVLYIVVCICQSQTHDLSLCLSFPFYSKLSNGMDLLCA